MFSAASKTSSQPAVAANYIEDVFSTWLYTGNGSTQTITNGIDLAGKGGMVWTKNRNNTQGNAVFDTVRGNTKYLLTQTTDGNQTSTDDITAFTSTGYTLGDNATTGNTNYSSAYTYCSWTFREQAKFFDIVTYTGNGGTQTINHNLGSTPGMVIIKRIDSTSLVGWVTYHRSVSSPNDNYLLLNSTAVPASAPAWISPTSTNFTIGNYSDVNANGGTFVAYLFAHNAGGFGTSGNDNVISCGSFTTDGSGNATVNLGYEPQYILCKYSSSISPWYVFDVMRGFSLTAQTALFPNTSSAENTYTGTGIFPTATGFSTLGTSLFDPNATLIYMAIRRPMKVPTTSTSVFSPIISSGSTGTVLTTGFPVDLQMLADRDGFNGGTNVVDRLRGVSSTATNFGNRLLTATTGAENSTFLPSRNWNNTSFAMPSSWGGGNNVFWSFRRAPGFFDVVCYNSNGIAGTQIPHNLGVKPQLMIVKCRNNAVRWVVYAEPLGATKYLVLNLDFDAATNIDPWNNTEPTASVFTVKDGTQSNAGFGYTYLAYLFATCPGVSKVGSYTGNGGTQAIACGFTGGARFVLIKRTDSTGDWYVYDTARGMVVSTDPYLLLNSAAAEVATTNSVITTTGGFTLTTSFGDTNASGGSYIFLAIA